MPELPDLEVFRDNIFRRLTSKRLIGLELFNARKVNGCTEDMMRDLPGQELIGIGRVGKELLFNFSGKKVVAVHFMLKGKTDIVKDLGEARDIRFAILALAFEHETIVFSDPGGLCTVRYMPLLDGAPDALDERFSLSYFLEKAKKRSRTNIKAFLIDQKVVRGIGNAYADEILWTARISPHSTVGKIPEAAMVTLYHTIGDVLRSAIRSIREIAPDIISGEERCFLKIHNKDLKKTETGYPIFAEKIASKTTYYTEEQARFL